MCHQDLQGLRGDYDRKYAELNRTVEQHTRLENQLDSITKKLGSISIVWFYKNELSDSFVMAIRSVRSDETIRLR